MDDGSSYQTETGVCGFRQRRFKLSLWSPRQLCPLRPPQRSTTVDSQLISWNRLLYWCDDASVLAITCAELPDRHFRKENFEGGPSGRIPSRAAEQWVEICMASQHIVTGVFPTVIWCNVLVDAGSAWCPVALLSPNLSSAFFAR